MDILQDIGSSITGSISKAKLYVKKKNTREGMSNTDLRDKLLSQSKSSLLKNPSQTLKAAAGVAESGKESGYHVMQVKYNPSSIKFSTQAGTYLHAGVGGMGMNQITQMTMPSQTIMTVDLIFDNLNITDAFMWDKNLMSLGGAVSMASNIYNEIANDGYSIQAQIDGLIALITQSEARNVVFHWSEMAFAGEVTSVNAQYTMFNPQGHPIRGKVTLGIFQMENEFDKGDKKYWDKAFNDLFGDYTEDGDVSDSSWMDNLNNLINFN